MNDADVMHAMSIDDAYHVERTLARGANGVTELVSIEGTGPFIRKKIPSTLAQRGVWAALASSRSNRLPHVVATYELPDCFVIVTDYVNGPTLTRYVEEHGRLSSDEAVRLSDQLCEAVRELHRLSIVNRDITPDNTIVAFDGAHIIDLGIARLTSEHPNRNRDTTTLGTYGFAAPEQYGFAPTDVRSDVYSIGRVLGFMLTGVYPDDGSYSRLLADERVVSRRMHDIVDRACSFEPSARYQNVDDLRTALHSPEDPVDTVTKTTRSRTASGGRFRGRMALIVGVIAVVAVAALVAGIIFLPKIFDDSTGTGKTDMSDTSSQMRNPPSDSQDWSDEQNGQDADSAPGDTSDAIDTAGLLELTETGWSVDSGYVHYGVGLHNTSDELCVDFPTIEITGRADDGSVLFSDTQVLNTLFAGETTYVGGQAGNGGAAPATVDFSVIAPERYNVRDSRESVSFTISNTSVLPERYGVTSFTGEIKAHTDGYEVVDGQQIRLSLILRDDQGEIVYGGMAFVDWPSSDRPRPFSIDVMNLPDYVSYEIYGQVW